MVIKTSNARNLMKIHRSLFPKARILLNGLNLIWFWAYMPPTSRLSVNWPASAATWSFFLLQVSLDLGVSLCTWRTSIIWRLLFDLEFLTEEGFPIIAEFLFANFIENSNAQHLRMGEPPSKEISPTLAVCATCPYLTQINSELEKKLQVGETPSARNSEMENKLQVQETPSCR